MPAANLTIERQEARFGRLLVLPSVLVIALLILYPIGFNVILSFFSVSFVKESTFVGFRNYLEILSDIAFWKSVLVTLVYVVFSTLGAAVVGVLVALLMNRNFRFRGLVRSLILLPYVAPVISVVFSWQFFFDPVQGIFTHLFVDVFSLSKERFNLIGNPDSALWVAIVFNIWRSFPFIYLMVLSRLQAVDATLYEAAVIDGATTSQQFKFITLPEIYFVVSAMVLLRFIWNFNKFEEVYLLTDNVRVLSVYTYFKAFIGTQSVGQASAVAVTQFLILVSFILVYVKKALKW